MSERKDEMNTCKRFHHYVKERDVGFEMEIFSDDGVWFIIHWPRWEFLGNQPCRMRLQDISALVFAYDEREYVKFLNALKSQYKTGEI